MDIQIRKYIQYEIRELSKRKKEQKKLEQRLKELRQEILDESPLPPRLPAFRRPLEQL